MIRAEAGSWKLDLGVPIYKVPMEEARCGAVFPGYEWSIPMIGADFLCFTSKSDLPTG